MGKITIEGISIRRVKLLRDRQFRKSVHTIRKELLLMGVDLNGVKTEEATKIYAKKIFDEEFIDVKDWVFSKVDKGYFKCVEIEYKQPKKVKPKKYLKKERKQKKQSYDDFLKSGYWRRVRNIVLKRDNNCCCNCGAKTNLHIHHTTYKHHLKELENLGDLITLCKKCHNEVHGRINGKNTIPLGEYETSYDMAKVEKLG